MKQLLSVITGSQAYGTNTPESDLDLSDIYAQTPDKLLGLSAEYQPHIQYTKDHKGFEIRRFIELLNVANPTTLEILHSPKDCILYYDDSLDVLFENRRMFLTKECIKTFGGMAMTQIEKATNTDKMMNWEEKRVERKTILDFCYMIWYGQTIPISEWFDQFDFLDQDNCGLVKLNHAPGAYAVYLGIKHQYKGIGDEKSNEVRLSSIPKGEDSVGTMFFNKDAYSKHCSDYKRYQEWLGKRNMDRLKTNKNHNQLVDCYLKSETEFLTEFGWKKYNDIEENTKIASINLEGKVIFDYYINRHLSSYTGQMFEYENRYSKFTVTSNHNLLVHFLNRKPSNNYSVKIDPKNIENFQFITVNDFHNKLRNYAKILHTPLYEYNKSEYDLTDEEIKILGAYISDGNLNKPVAIIIDQKDDKPLFEFLKNSNYYSTLTYTGSYTKEEYHRFRYKNKKLVDFIVDNVGEGSFNKHLSQEFFKFSKRQFLLLLEFMIKGDGHKHAKGHDIYYTSSKQLASDLQLLLFMNGMNSQIYTVLHKGGFEKSASLKYQVFIPKTNIQLGTICRTKNWNSINVENQDVCCFTTKHGNLITKNNNKISIQGNSKNLSHSYRLVMMAKEIVETGNLQIRRPPAEVNHFLKIKRGEVNLFEIIDWVKSEIQELKTLYQNSILPDSVDLIRSNEILLEIRNNITYDL